MAPPLGLLARDLASDVFASLGGVAGAAGRVIDGARMDGEGAGEEEEGFAVLREQVGERVVQEMVEFWAEEWAVE